jgi:hypothetical protein
MRQRDSEFLIFVPIDRFARGDVHDMLGELILIARGVA